MNKRVFIKILPVLLNIGVVFWAITVRANTSFILMFLVWINMMVYAYRRIEKRVLLFAFGIAFFVFLIGREMLEQLFFHEIDDQFNDAINTHTYISMGIALLSVWGAYTLFSRKRTRLDNSRPNCDTPYIRKIRTFSKIAFYATYPFAMAMNIAIAIFVSTFGYLSYYTDYSELLAGNPLLYTISKLELIMPAALCIFMATLPSKKEIKWLLIYYVAYLLLTLGGGQRSTFVLGLLLIFIFAAYMQGIRPEENWFKQRYMGYCCLLLPLLAIMGSLYNMWRFGEDLQDINPFASFFDFFYDQGVTSYIIKRSYEMEADIPGNCIYALEFLHSGVPARLLGIPVYHGNTIEHALYGNSFTHALGYTVMGNTYLAGKGTGSCYIAELFYDFGYTGIALGSALYGWIFAQVSKGAKNKILRRAIVFIIVTQLLWACRASYTGFLSFLFAPSTLLLLVFVFGGAKIASSRRRTNKSSDPSYQISNRTCRAQ